jgi:hypothetical protein
MANLANHPSRRNRATRQGQNLLCVIIGWRRIVGKWDDIHCVVPTGISLVREGTGFRAMYSAAFEQELLA